jgi:hypothetical protein
MIDNLNVFPTAIEPTEQVADLVNSFELKPNSRGVNHMYFNEDDGVVRGGREHSGKLHHVKRSDVGEVFGYVYGTDFDTAADMYLAEWGLEPQVPSTASDTIDNTIPRVGKHFKKDEKPSVITADMVTENVRPSSGKHFKKEIVAIDEAKTVPESAVQEAQILPLDESRRKPKTKHEISRFRKLGAVALTALAAVAGLAVVNRHNSGPLLGMANAAATETSTTHPNNTTTSTAEGTSTTSSTSTTSTTEVRNTAGQEVAYDIALEGSCSPYNAEMAAQAAAGNFKAFGDFKTVQAAFLEQHPGFDANFTAGARQRIPYLFDGLKLGPNATMADATASPDFMQGILLEPLSNVANTYCDAEGNVHFYTDTVLAAGTGVGGLEITSMQESNGVMVAVLSNGEVMPVPADALVASVEKLDGTQATLLITNKLGLETTFVDAQGVSHKVFIGCDNILNKIIPEIPEVTEAPTSTTSSTTSTTSTTVAKPKRHHHKPAPTVPSTSTTTTPLRLPSFPYIPPEVVVTVPTTEASTTTTSTSTTSTTEAPTSTTSSTTSTTEQPKDGDENNTPGANKTPVTADPSTGPSVTTSTEAPVPTSSTLPSTGSRSTTGGSATGGQSETNND